MKFDQSGLVSRVRSGLRALSTRVERASLFPQWLLYLVVKRLSRTWTRDDSLWVFGARGGDAFVDNAKYLYLHVADEQPGVRSVWLSKNRRVVRELRKSGYEAHYCYSFRGLLANLRAGVVVVTQGHRDVVMPCCAGAKTVLLWHGVPLKNVSWDAEFPDEPAPLRAVHEYMAGEFDRLAVPGENLTDVFESGLHIDPDRMVITGYPRLDPLFGPVRGSDLGTDETAGRRVRRLSRDSRVVFYLPTFRDDSAADIAAHLDFRALDDFLEREDAYLVVKTHARERFSFPPNLSRIVSLPEQCDVYPLLRFADVLVTDYSSVYFDFLYLDRPVVFYAFDRARYEETRGFYFDYDEITAGPIASDFDDLLAALSQVLEDDSAVAARRTTRRHLLTDVRRDGHQSASVYDAIVQSFSPDESI
ncbi:CDP-glycerol glycerophosphotransferase family protein [Haladaptatus sp. NG-WS-4]